MAMLASRITRPALRRVDSQHDTPASGASATAPAETVVPLSIVRPQVERAAPQLACPMRADLTLKRFPPSGSREVEQYRVVATSTTDAPADVVDALGRAMRGIEELIRAERDVCQGACTLEIRIHWAT